MEEENLRKRKCEKCKRRINLGNYELHQANCKPKEPKPKRKEIEQKVREAMEARRRDEEANRDPQEEGVNREPEEKFPCFLCGQMQTLAELDTHPRRCPNRQIPCTFCSQRYPTSLMPNHKEVCERRPRPIPQPAAQLPASNALASSPTHAVHNYRPSQPVIRPVRPLQQASNPSSRPQPPVNRSQSVAVVHYHSHAHFAAPSGFSRSESLDNASRNVPARLGNPPPPRPRVMPPSPPRPVPSSQAEASQNARNNIPTLIRSESNNIFANYSRVAAQSNGSRGTNPYLAPSNRVAESMQSLRHAVDRQRVVEEVDRLRQAYLAQQLAARHATKKEEGLPRDMIKLIPEKKHVVKHGAEEQLCAICCTEFTKNDKLKDLRCKHDFHTKCISDWLRINRSCPLCKADLSVNVKDPESRSTSQNKKKSGKNPSEGPINYLAYLDRLEEEVLSELDQ